MSLLFKNQTLQLAESAGMVYLTAMLDGKPAVIAEIQVLKHSQKYKYIFLSAWVTKIKNNSTNSEKILITNVILESEI